MPKPQLFDGHPDGQHPLARQMGKYIQFDGAGGSTHSTLRDAIESIASKEQADVREACNRYLDDSRFFPERGPFGGGGPLGGDPAGGGR